VHFVWHAPLYQAHAASPAHASLLVTVEQLALQVAVMESHWQAGFVEHVVRVVYSLTHFSEQVVPVTWHCGCVKQSVVVRVAQEATQVLVLDENMHCESWLQSSAVA
jgi:hypothetical protein